MAKKGNILKNYLLSNLKWLLLRDNLSIAELSMYCGIDQSEIDYLLEGDVVNPKISTLFTICDYYNCTIENLIKEDFSTDEITVHPDKVKLCHAMRNSLSIIQVFHKRLESNLPVLLEAYEALPERLQKSVISKSVFNMLPKMLAYAVTSTDNMRDAINGLDRA